MTASLHFAPREDGGGLRLPDLLRLKRLAELVEPSPGGTLLEEGVPADALFLVRRGEVVVEKRDADGHPRVLARLGEGAVFGELSFLDGQPASATIRAAEAAQVARLPRQRLDSDPALAGLKARLITHLAREVVARLRTTDGSFTEALRAEGRQARLRDGARLVPHGDGGALRAGPGGDGSFTEALRAEGRQARLRTELGWFLMVTVGADGVRPLLRPLRAPLPPPGAGGPGGDPRLAGALPG
jgi:CRP/FNR family cyclic AMP-dependent transcriptional regulator